MLHLFCDIYIVLKKNTYWLNELWKTRLPKRLKWTILTNMAIPVSLCGSRVRDKQSIIKYTKTANIHSIK